MVTQLASDFLPGGTSGGGEVPFRRISPTPPGTSIYNGFIVAAFFKGFDVNGDYVSSPTGGNGAATAGQPLQYLDNTNTLQWSLARTAFQGTADIWSGFYMDRVDGLIYVMTVDVGTTNNTFQLSSVDQAGTITVIGSSQPPFGNQASSSTGGWNTNTSGASLIYREQEGSGNIFLQRARTNAATEIAEIDITNGSLVSGPTAIWADASGKNIQGLGGETYYKTSNKGWLISFTSTTIPQANGHMFRVIDENQNYVGTFALPDSQNWFPFGDAIARMQPWGDEVSMHHLGTSSFSSLINSEARGAKWYNRAELDLWLEELITIQTGIV